MMQEEPAYQPKDAIQVATRTTLTMTLAGFLIAATKNSLTRHNVGAMGVFTQYGGIIGLAAGSGAAYSLVSTASANLREIDDSYNKAIGGFCAGALLGFRRRTVPSVVGRGVLVAVTMATAHYTGYSIFHDAAGPDEDRLDRKMEIRNRFRRPVNELINEVGEGRGIYGPNYEERRKKRIKENFGIDVPEPYYKNQ